jgi:glycosyltransferase involved in cell wall biosynthesis
MRVLLSHVYAWPEVLRGGERILHELGAALHRAGVDVEIVTTAPIPGRTVELGVPVRRLRRRELRPERNGPLADEAAFGVQAFAHALRRRPDVWHALGTADAAAAARLGQVLPVRSVHTALGFPARASREARPDRRAHEVVVRHVDRYCTLSADAGRHLFAGWGRIATVLPGGVDTGRFRPPTGDERGRDPDPTVFFPAAPDEERKNLPLLLRAFADVLAVHPRARLLLTGDGGRDALASAPPGVAAAVGRLPASPATPLEGYRRAWVTALPARAEAQGLVVIESLACGTPAAVLEGGAPAEAVTAETGTTSAETAADHARALLDGIELARLSGTTEACRERSLLWDWDRAIVPRTLAVYA